MYTCATFPSVTAAMFTQLNCGRGIPFCSHLHEPHLTLSSGLHDYGWMFYRAVSPAQKRRGHA